MQEKGFTVIRPFLIKKKTGANTGLFFHKLSIGGFFGIGSSAAHAKEALDDFNDLNKNLCKFIDDAGDIIRFGDAAETAKKAFKIEISEIEIHS